jgi:hypothetical protein
MLRKKPEKKPYENRCPEKKTQRKRYKYSVRRQVHQIKTTAGHCENFQYENKGLSKNKNKNKQKTAKSMAIFSTGSFVCTSDT